MGSVKKNEMIRGLKMVGLLIRPRLVHQSEGQGLGVIADNLRKFGNTRYVFLRSDSGKMSFCSVKPDVDIVWFAGSGVSGFNRGLSHSTRVHVDSKVPQATGSNNVASFCTWTGWGVCVRYLFFWRERRLFWNAHVRLA